MRFRRRVAAKLGDLAWGSALLASLELTRRRRPAFEVPRDPPPPSILHAGALGADVAAFCATWPDRVATRLARADRICELDFGAPGEDAPRIGTNRRGFPRALWHTEPRSGHTWPRSATSPFLRLVGPEGSDVLRSWRLSRMQHLPALGQAHLLSSEPRYAEAFRRQITDWIAANPLGHGVNWTSSMEAGLRAVSWLIALEAFRSCDRVRHDERLLRRIYGSLGDHARFIALRARMQMQRGRAGSNHHIVAVTGLGLIAACCPFFRGSAAWGAFATERLLRTAEDQVLGDGWNFEASTSYHRLVLECYLSTLLIAKRRGIEAVRPLEGITRRMCNVVRDSVNDDAHTPQIGDNDGSRLLRLCEHASLDRGYLLGLAAVFFDEPSYRLPGVGPDEDVFWLFGARGLRAFDALGPGSREPAAMTFPDVGWHVIRTGDVHCFVSCGPNGQGGQGGHAHNDKLSLTLRVGRHDLLVDPGSPNYGDDPDARNDYRSTRWHNTFAARDCEQNRITNDIFLLEDRVQVAEARLAEEASRIVFQGEIRYGDVVHRRRVMVQRHGAFVRIEDRVERKSRAGGVVSFHLAPRIGYRGGDLVESATGTRVARLKIRGGEVREEAYEYSPTHGVRQAGRRIVVVVPPGLSEAVVETEIRGA